MLTLALSWKMKTREQEMTNNQPLLVDNEHHLIDKEPHLIVVIKYLGCYRSFRFVDFFKT